MYGLCLCELLSSDRGSEKLNKYIGNKTVRHTITHKQLVVYDVPWLFIAGTVDT